MSGHGSVPGFSFGKSVTLYGKSWVTFKKCIVYTHAFMLNSHRHVMPTKKLGAVWLIARIITSFNFVEHFCQPQSVSPPSGQLMALISPSLKCA